jgi:hypothetical protein
MDKGVSQVMFDAYVDESKTAALQNDLAKFSDGLEKATTNRVQEALVSGRARTAREIKTHNAANLTRFYMAIGIDPASMVGTAETVTGSLYVDDTDTIPLYAFRATQTDVGVVVDMDWAGHQQVIYPGAFGPNIPRLGGNLYRRIGRGSRPIEKIADLRTSSVPGVRSLVEKQAGPMRLRMTEKLKEDKQRLSEEFRSSRSQ